MITYVFSHHAIRVRMESKLKCSALLYMRNTDIPHAEHSYVSVTGILDLGRSDFITSAPIKAGFKTLIYCKIYLFNLVHNTTVVPVLGKLYLQDLSIKNKEKKNPI